MTAKLGMQNCPKTQYLSSSVRASLDTCVLQYILRKKSNRKQLNPKWQERLGSEKQRVSSSGLCREVFTPCRQALYPEIVFKSVKCANAAPRSVIFSVHFQRPKKCPLCIDNNIERQKRKNSTSQNLGSIFYYFPYTFMNSVKCP